MAEAGRPLDWRPWLKPGERILWQGRPRAGAGWGRALADVDAEDLSEPSLLMLMLTLAIMAALGGAWLGALNIAVLMAPLVLLLAAFARWRLGHTYYAITDRRTLRLRGVFGPGHLTAVSHDDLDLQVTGSASEQTIYVGRDYDSYRSAPRPPGPRSFPAHGAPNLFLRGLAPETSPAELLRIIARDGVAPASAGLAQSDEAEADE